MKQKKMFNFPRICVLTIIVYLVFVIAFYFLAGYQLHFRNSRGNIKMSTAESATIELTEGVIIEQNFNTTIQRIQAINVQWETYYRENDGIVIMELVRLDNREVVLSDIFDVATIIEGGVTTMAADEPIEGLYEVPLVLRIYSNSQPGRAASPMMSLSSVTNDFSLLIDGNASQGSLCFSVTGEDYIWTGLHYWQFAAALGAVILTYFLFVSYRWKKGKSSILINGILALQRYKFLIKQLVERDFKSKYKRSVLGVFWSFLNPLLNMFVQYTVFSNLFRFDIPYFPVYLLCGNVIFNYFSESCSMSLTSITGNASLITKVYVPKYIYPLTRIMSSMINLVISLLPLLIVALVMGIMPTKAIVLIIFPLLCMAIFCLGMGMLLAAAMVFFRDVQFLWGVLTTIWMYLTPIFYPVSILEEHLAWVIKVNPIYYYITFLRICIIDGISPEPIIYIQSFLFAVGSFVTGSLIFKKTQDRFVLYL